MSEFKGTKGKWSVKGRTNLSVKSCIEENGIALDYPICDMSWKFKTIAENLANAQLISHAPELLEAMQNIAKSCDGNNPDHAVFYFTATKAIEQATTL